MSQQPVVNISPAECPFCDDWEKRLRDVNKHIPLSETLVVTPSQFKHHVGAHMEQLALFAIPRGSSEEGEADSGSAAPEAGSDQSSLAISLPDPQTAMDLKACEEFLMKMNDNKLLVEYFKVPFQACRPTLEDISQALESGNYKTSTDFTQDFRQMMNQFTHDIRHLSDERALLLAHVMESSVEAPKAMATGIAEELRREFISFCTDRQRSALVASNLADKWRRWRAGSIPRAKFPPVTRVSPSTLEVAFVNNLGGVIRGYFYETATEDDLYAFVDCYEFLDHASLATSAQPIGYTHKYPFKLEICYGSQSSLGLYSARFLTETFGPFENLPLGLVFNVVSIPTSQQKQRSPLNDENDLEKGSDDDEVEQNRPKVIDYPAQGETSFEEMTKYLPTDERSAWNTIFQLPGTPPPVLTADTVAEQSSDEDDRLPALDEMPASLEATDNNSITSSSSKPNADSQDRGSAVGQEHSAEHHVSRAPVPSKSVIPVQKSEVGGLCPVCGLNYSANADVIGFPCRKHAAHVECGETLEYPHCPEWYVRRIFG